MLWANRLDVGKNRPLLKLIAAKPLPGVVVAPLEHRNRSETFQLRVDAG